MHWVKRIFIAVTCGLVLAPIIFYALVGQSSDTSFTGYLARIFAMPLAEYAAFVLYGCVVAGVYAATGCARKGAREGKGDGRNVIKVDPPHE